MAQSSQSLVADSSPPQPISDDDLHDWGSDQRVFISSVIAGMSEERETAAASIEGVGATPVWFERFGGRDDDPESAYLGEVARSDVYLGILGERYGKPQPSGYSATHAEYHEAVRRGLRISVWVLDGELSGPQRDFVDEVRVFQTTGSYGTSEELGRGVDGRLRLLAAEDLSPWVKIGDAILRARSVTFDGKNLRFEARVRDEAVVSALEGLRPGGFWRGPRETRVTWAGRTEPVVVRSVESKTSTGRGAFIVVSAERVASASLGSAFTEMAISSRSPEELGELAVRVAIFGEANPMGLMSFAIRMTNPFPVIAALRLPEDAVEPAAHLLLTEELVASGRAERITSLQVGPMHRGRRRVEIAWQPRRRFANEIPEERRVEGEVTLAQSD